MVSKSFIIAAIIAYVEARFGQEQVPIDAISSVQGGDAGAAATIGGAAISDLLGGANACDKLTTADQIFTELGGGADALAAAIGMVTAEKNTNPFANGNVQNACGDPTLPVTPELRGITPLIDPDVDVNGDAAALSESSAASPLDATGLSVFDLMDQAGLGDLVASQAAGGGAAAGGAAADDAAQGGNQANDDQQAGNDNNQQADNQQDAAVGQNDAAAGQDDAAADDNAGADCNAGNAAQDDAADDNNQAANDANNNQQDAAAGNENANNNQNANAGNNNANAGNNNQTANAGNNNANAGNNNQNANAGNNNANDNAADNQQDAAAGNDNANDNQQDAAAGNDAAAGGAVAAGDVDFGLCTPTITFQAGENGRAADEFTFQIADPLARGGQGEALNPDIITNALCNQLTNVCEANDAAVTQCEDAAAQVQGGARDKSTADTFNGLLGFAGAVTNPDGGPEDVADAGAAAAADTRKRTMRRGLRA